MGQRMKNNAGCEKGKIIIATRSSALALAQAEIIAKMLNELGYETALKTVKTGGDRDHHSPLREIGGNGLFVKEVELSLLDGEADIAVHSAKDLPYELMDGLTIAATPGAADARDCLVIRKGFENKKELVIGTGSPRRAKECGRFYKNAEYREIRGNIDTRLDKLRRGEYDAIFLAKAGLDRLSPELSDFTIRIFEAEEIIPAACQGILAVEARSDDRELLDILENINDPLTRLRFETERSIFTDKRVSCKEAVAVHAAVNGDNIKLYTLFDEKRKVREFARGNVTLVGAGCKKEHLTLEGLNAIKAAEVIVYDDLLDTDILYFANESCELIYAGKREGAALLKQNEINDILIKLALFGKKVVRLKGGDSFVFGRGGEEVMALRAKGICVSTVAGVTSGIAVPESFGLPVTHRGTASSVTFVTGHGTTEVNEDFEVLAALKGTLVFYMGLSRAEEIADKLMANGKSADTRVSVLSCGFRALQKRYDGRLCELSALAKNVKAPALIVVGDAAGLWLFENEKKPLLGALIEVTGSEYFTAKTAASLKKYGAFVKRSVSIAFKPCYEMIPENFSLYSWLVFTSSNGIRIFFDGLKQKNIDIRCIFGLKIACIGRGTGDTLLEYGMKADYIPDSCDVKGLAEGMCGILSDDDRVLILRAKNGSKELNRIFDENEIKYTDAAIYETKGRENHIKNMDDKSPDYIVFGSCLGAKYYLERHSVAECTKIVCIGAETAAAFENTDVLLPKQHTADAIASLIASDYKGRADLAE